MQCSKFFYYCFSFLVYSVLLECSTVVGKFLD